MGTSRIRNPRARWFASLIPVVAAGCGVSDATVPALRIEMSSSQFKRDSTSLSAIIPLQLRNYDSLTVYVLGCGPRPMLTLQQWTGTGWQDRISPIGCISNPASIALISGATLADTERCALVGTFRFTVSYGLNPSQPFDMPSTGSVFTVQ